MTEASTHASSATSIGADPADSGGPSWAPREVDRVAAPLREQVMASLRQAIFEGRLAPGQRLVERELIETLGVSRTTVREALRELTSEGLITVVPQRGAIVSTLGDQDARDLYELRGLLESLMARRFVERASEASVRRLRSAFEVYASQIDARAGIQAYLRAKADFYDALSSGAHSESLRQLLEGIQGRVQLLRSESLAHAGRAEASRDELRAIVDAIEARDGDRAAELTRLHIEQAAQTALDRTRTA